MITPIEVFEIDVTNSYECSQTKVNFTVLWLWGLIFHSFFFILQILYLPVDSITLQYGKNCGSIIETDVKGTGNLEPVKSIKKKQHFHSYSKELHLPEKAIVNQLHIHLLEKSTCSIYI